MFKKSLIFVSGVMLSSLLPLAAFATDAATLSFPSRASTLAPASDVANVKPFMVSADCQDAQNIKTIFIGKNGETRVWQTSSCPTGTASRTIKNYSGTALNGGAKWRYECCKTNAAYQ